MYVWDDFTKEEYFAELCGFMNDVLQPDLKRSVIFVSRKAYCLFLLFKKKKLISADGIKVYTDRLIMKNRDPELFKGETVYLVDDSVSTGNHLLEVYRIVKERTEFEEIKINIFIKDREFNEDKFIADSGIGDKDKLTICQSLATSTKLKFCAIETLLFHQENIPYLVELPYLTEKDSEEDYVTLSAEQYEELKRDYETWSFFECNQYGYRQSLIENAVLVMNSTLTDVFPQFIFCLTVRMQITTNEDGSKNIVMAPFAILKSISFDELIKCFYSIFEGTDYGKSMYWDEKRLGDKFPEFSYMAVFRAIVYVLSYYTGLQLIDFLKNIICKELIFQTKNDSYCYEEGFRFSVEQIFGKENRYFFRKLYLFRGFSDVERKNNLKPYIAKYGKLGKDYEIVYLYILALINDVRMDGSWEKIERISWKKFLSIEEFQEALQLSYDSRDESEIKNVMIRCLCCMLAQSKIANEIIYDAGDRIVYRGFKYADNSESFFDITAKAFYAAVAAYYTNVGIEGYAKCYERFLVVIKEFFIHNNLYGNVVQPDAFRIYAEIFRKGEKKNLEKQIDRLEFLIEEKIPIYIEKISDYISEVDFSI